MKILFLNPPWWETDNGRLRIGVRAGSRWPFTKWATHLPDQFRFGDYKPFPFFLAHAAAHTQMLMPYAQVEIRDSIARGESYIRFDEAICEIEPDWIIIETATPSLDHDLRVISRTDLKLHKVILCGPIDSAKYQEIFDKHPNVHCIVKGEYDRQIKKAIESSRGTVLEHDLLTVEEMNAAPPPMWDEACATHYWDACPEGQKAPQLQLWASRGCPFKCCFCSWPAVMTGNDPDGTKPRAVRCYSPEYVEHHIRERLSKAAYRSIYLDDDTANLNEKHTLEICAVMKRIGLPWSAMCRADTLSCDAWQAMKDSGCFGVKIGFESGNQWVIDNIVNKRLNLAKAAETCRWLQTIGIKVHGTFTTGLPGETKEQQADTMQFIQMLYDTNAISTHQLSGTATISGTPLDAIAHGEHLAKFPGAIADKDFVVSGDGQRKIETLGR